MHMRIWKLFLFDSYFTHTHTCTHFYFPIRGRKSNAVPNPSPAPIPFSEHHWVSGDGLPGPTSSEHVMEYEQPRSDSSSNLGSAPSVPCSSSGG